MNITVPANCTVLSAGLDDIGMYVLVRREDGEEEKIRPPPLPSFAIEVDVIPDDPANDMRQIRNVMDDLALGPATLNGILGALQELHRLRHLYPPTAERERRAVSALEAIAYHSDGPLGGVVNVTKLSDALADIAKAGLRPD